MNKNDNMDHFAKLRASSLPEFVDGEWVKAQFGPAPSKKQRDIAKSLSNCYEHWSGEEEEMEFYEKIAQDLSIPGFIRYLVFDALRGEDGKSLKKKPFHFMISRFHSYLEPSPESMVLNDKNLFMGILSKAVERNKDEDIRDFAFFTAIFMENPNEIMSCIIDTSAYKDLVDFLTEFGEKIRQKNELLQDAELADFRNQWQQLLNNLEKKSHSWANDTPNSDIVKEIDQYAEKIEVVADNYLEISEDIKKREYVNFCQSIADKLAPFNRREPIKTVHAKILQQKDISNLGDFIAENVKDKIDILVKFIKEKEEFWNDMRKCQQEEDTQGISVCNEKIQELEENIKTAITELPVAFGGSGIVLPKSDALTTDESSSDTPLPSATEEPKVSPPPVITPITKRVSKSEPEIKPEREIKPEPDIQSESVPDTHAKIVDKVNRIIKNLILLEEFDVAYHMAYCGEKLVPNGVFMFPATALYLLAFPERSTEINNVGDLENILTQGVSEETKIVVFAAALFPAVFNLSSGARNLYEGVLVGCDNLDTLRKKIVSFETWSVGANNFNLSQYPPQDIIARAKKDLSDWYYAKEKKMLQFAPATHGWQNWMKRNGLLGAVIFPLIGKNHLGGLTAAKTFLSRYQDDGSIGNEIDNIPGKIPGKKIEGSVNRQLRNLIKEGISFINAMVDALQNEGKRSDKSVVLSRKCDEFYGALQQAREMINNSDSVGHYCLQRAFDFFEENNMHIILSGEKHNKVPGLAKVSDARHDYLGTPFKYSDRLLYLVEQSLDNEEFKQDEVKSCQRQISKKALLSAQLLLENIDKYDDKYKELEHDIKQRISIFREDLKEKINKLDRELNIVQMPHGEKEELREKLIRIDTDKMPSREQQESEIIVDFPQAYDIYSDIKRRIDEIGSNKLEELRNRAKEAVLSDKKRGVVQKMLEDGNYIFAEYLLNLKEEDMPDMRLLAPHIQLFFKKGYIGKAKKDAAFNGERKNNFNKTNGVEKKRREELLEKWSAMFTGSSDSLMNAVKKWLEALNFDVNNIEIINKSSDYQMIKVKTQSLDMPPVADFGSRAKGNYLIMLASAKMNITTMHQAFENATGSGARFIFYNGILSEHERDEFRSINESSERMAALFDRATLMYLCLEEEEDLRKMFFDLSLPFSGINPFIKESADVPVEMFYGRQLETNSIISGDSRLVYGGRMLGKTALLHHVRKKEHRPKDNCFAFVVDIKEGNSAPRLNDNPNLIWDVIWDKLESECNPKNIKKKNADNKLEEWLQNNEECRLLVMIDEADGFLEKDIAGGSPNLTRFKNLMDGSDGRFKAVFAGLHNVKRHSRSANTAIARYGKPICVGPFEGGEQAAAVRLITEPFAAAGFIFENELLPLEIANRTNFYPSLIQYLCHYWLSELRFITGGIRKITAEHIKNAFAKDDWQVHLADVFGRTLDLDKRYALIAYVIALDTYKARKEGRIAQGLSIAQLRNECSYWKADSMKKVSNEEFHCLLEEMAELGVLRHSEKRNWWLLRSELVLLLIGDEIRVEDKIMDLSEDEFTTDIISSDLHRRKSSDIGYAPLTARQEDVLVELSGKEKRWHCRVVLGGIAAGIGYVSNLLEDIAKERKWGFRLHHGENGIGGMIRELDKFTKEIRLKKLERGVWVVKDAPWSSEWLEYFINDRATSKYPVVIVFLGDGGYIKELDKDNNDYPYPVYLSPVGGAIINDMLVHYNSEVREKIKEVSANFLSPINELSNKINSLTDENNREKWRQNIISREDKMEFWGLPKVWENYFFDLMALILDKEGKFNKEDMIYGWQEIGGYSAFSGWTADEIFKILERLSLITPIREDSEATDKKSVKYRLIYPLRL